MSSKKKRPQQREGDLKMSHLQPGGSVPPNTTLRGKLYAVARPYSENGETRCSIFLDAKLHRDPDDPNPYISKDKKAVKHKIRCDYAVRGILDLEDEGNELNQLLMDHNRLEVQVGGSKVVKWQSGEEIEVTLEVDGSIRLQPEGGAVQTFLDRKRRRETPSWMTSPPPPQGPCPAAAAAPAGKLKPVSTFFPFPARQAPAPPVVTPSEDVPAVPSKKARLDLSQNVSRAQLPSSIFDDEDLPPDMEPSAPSARTSDWPEAATQDLLAGETDEAQSLEAGKDKEEELPESAETGGFALIVDAPAAPEGDSTPPLVAPEQVLGTSKKAADGDHMEVDEAERHSPERHSLSSSPPTKKALTTKSGPSKIEQLKTRRMKEAQSALAAQEESERRRAAKVARRESDVAEPSTTSINENIAEDDVPAEEVERALRASRAAAKAQDERRAREELKAQEKRERRKAEEARVRKEAQERAAAQEARTKAAASGPGNLAKGLQTSGVQYTVLSEIHNVIKGHIMGVVLEATGMKTTRTGDWLVNVVVTDPTTYDGPSGEDFVVSIFKAKQQDLPDVERGMPIILRNVMVKPYNGKPKGQVFRDVGSGWARLHNHSIKGDLEAFTPKITKLELDRLKALEEWWKNGAQGYQPAGGSATVSSNFAPRLSVGSAGGRNSLGPSQVAGKRGLITLGEAQPDEFFHAAFKILAVMTRGGGGGPGGGCWAEMYITDGTLSNHSPRNFHNVAHDRIPPNGIFCLSIMDKPPIAEQPLYQEGKILKMNNIRSKIYKDQLELKWSERLTEQQADAGWNRRRVTKLEAGSSEAKAIESRLKALKRGEVPSAPSAPSSPSKSSVSAAPLRELDSITTAGSSVAAIPDAPANEEVPLATHLGTVHVDPISHPLSSISEIIANQTRPNKFRLRARVERLIPRAGDGYVQKHCKKCRRAFTHTYCQSCNDTALANAEYRYRLIALLDPASGGGGGAATDAKDRLPVFISDEEAAEFLPALPPVGGSTNPNDLKKVAIRLKQCCAGTENVLLGPRMNGERVRPIIEWSVESWLAVDPHNQKKKQQQNGTAGAGAGAGNGGVVVWKAFGMAAK